MGERSWSQAALRSAHRHLGRLLRVIPLGALVLALPILCQEVTEAEACEPWLLEVGSALMQLIAGLPRVLPRRSALWPHRELTDRCGHCLRQQGVGLHPSHCGGNDVLPRARPLAGQRTVVHVSVRERASTGGLQSLLLFCSLLDPSVLAACSGKQSANWLQWGLVQWGMRAFALQARLKRAWLAMMKVGLRKRRKLEVDLLSSSKLYFEEERM